MNMVGSQEDEARGAQDALDALFATRLKIRESAEKPAFELKEVASDDRPVLIQCCIR
jgi:hypothetical protein